jgi:D-alanyl-D-alanine dipeptidase
MASVAVALALNGAAPADAGSGEKARSDKKSTKGKSKTEGGKSAGLTGAASSVVDAGNAAANRLLALVPPPKPTARTDLKPVKLCVDDQTCAKLCKGGKADKDKARARMAELGLSEDTKSLVRAPSVVRDYLVAMGCSPSSEDTKSGTKNCGVVYAKDDLRILRGAAYGLAKAALAAKKRGYVLRVSSTYRSMLEQLDGNCSRLKKGMSACDPVEKPCAGLGKGGHLWGFAVDLCVTKDGKECLSEPSSGPARTCAKNRSRLKERPHDRALAEIMLSAGWWWYCPEMWHYEYSDKPINDERINQL